MSSSTATCTVTARYATLTHTPGHTNTIAMSTRMTITTSTRKVIHTGL